MILKPRIYLTSDPICGAKRTQKQPNSKTTTKKIKIKSKNQKIKKRQQFRSEF
jgi:hypothetical protein